MMNRSDVVLPGFGCDPDGYRGAVEASIAAGMPKFYRFYQETPEFKRGQSVFSEHLLPFVEKYVKNRRRSMEIGYGPGGIVFAASKYFDWAAGVDVILHKDVVAEELRRNGCENFELYVGDGKSIPIEDGVADFVYSWTVFMHVGKPEIVQSYLAECYRVMQADGVAALYWARLCREKHDQTKAEWEKSIADEVDLYREAEKPVNQINLRLSMRWMENEAEKAGFKILERTASLRYVDGVAYYQGQHCLVLRKP